ncbi:MAG: quinol dehydrogenase ferredoxin subunit NapH [Calditrichaeota bacterium]|nr:MAG: quinol dehydrogenase ferredoxin subunit NapH [Calditrichota bacterium]
MSKLKHDTHLTLARRATQTGIILLFISGSRLGWDILQGNLSFSRFLDFIPMTDPFAFLQMLFAGAVISTDMILGTVIVLVLYGLFFGRAFCAWVCPMNILSEWAARLRVWLDKNKPGSRITVSRNIRFWLLGLALLLSIVFHTAAFELISPVSILHRGLIFGFGLGWTLILAVFLFDLVIVKNGFCGHICPLGAFYTLIGKYALLKISHNHKACTQCMDCKVVCPELPVLKNIGKESGAITGACTRCGRCIEACNDKALKFDIINPFKN